MKLVCMKYHRDLVAYADGELPPDKAQIVERHLKSCGSCRLEVAQLRQLNALAPPALIEPDADFDRVFWTRLAQERGRGEHPRFVQMLAAAKAFFISPAGLSLSAALAMGVFVVSLYLLRPGDPAQLKQQELMAAADLDLYANFDVIQNSEALENFELIEMLDELQQQDEQG